MSSGPDMKVVLLGRHDAGKTCLADRFLNDKFGGNYQATIGAAFGARRIFVEETSIVMGLWDTAGSERYESVSKTFYRGAWAAVICFDLTDEKSFERVKFWVAELQTQEESCRIYLCGTKKDKIDNDKSCRQVDYHTALEYADENGGTYFETSSRTGENVKEVFLDIATVYVHSPSFREKKRPSHVQLSSTTLKSKRKGCC